MTTRLTAIDVGITYLGMARFRTPTGWDQDALPEHLEEGVVVDTTAVKHEKVPEWACTLHHDREISDWLDHVVQEYPDFFAPNVETILVERQPPLGLHGVQGYFFKRFRERVKLVSPTHVQCVMGFRILGDRMARKAAVVELTTEFLHVANAPWGSQVHDLADAIAIGLCHFRDLQRRREKDERQRESLALQNQRANLKHDRGRSASLRASPYFDAQDRSYWKDFPVRRPVSTPKTTLHPVGDDPNGV